MLRWMKHAFQIAEVMRTANEFVRESRFALAESNLLAELHGGDDMPPQMQVVLDIGDQYGDLLVYTPYDEDFVTDLKRQVPPRFRWWDEKRGCWHVTLEWTGDVQELLEEYYGDISHHYSERAIDVITDLVIQQRQTDAFEDKREREQADRRRAREQARRSREQSPPPDEHEPPPHEREEPTPAIDPNEPHRVLGVTEDAPRKVVEAAYKAQATLNHPDMDGGSEEAMVRINAAYEEIRRQRGWHSPKR